MEDLELLERRAVELITEVINDACDGGNLPIFAGLRIDLAILWQMFAENLPDLFHRLYLDSILKRIVGAGTEEDRIESLDDFKAIEDATENPFLAPVLVFAAAQLNWELITSYCLDSYFGPCLMGNFSSPADALEYYQDEYDRITTNPADEY